MDDEAARDRGLRRHPDRLQVQRQGHRLTLHAVSLKETCGERAQVGGGIHPGRVL